MDKIQHTSGTNRKAAAKQILGEIVWFRTLPLGLTDNLLLDITTGDIKTGPLHRILVHQGSTIELE
jgi:hypothetical protein